MDNINFGISGIAGSGKDTLAGMMLDELHRRGLTEYSKYSYAGPLKRFAQDVFGFSDFDVYDQYGKEDQFTKTYNKAYFRDRFEIALAELLLLSKKDKETLDDLWIRFLDVLHEQIVPNSLFVAVVGWFNSDKALITFNSTPRIILQLLGTEFFRDSISESFWTDIAPKANAVIADMRFVNELDYIIEVGGVPIGIIGRDEDTTSSSQHASENVGPVINRCKHIIKNDGTLEDLRLKAVKIIDTELGKVE